MKRYDRSNWFYCHIICLQAFRNGFIFEVVDFEHNNNEIILNIFNMFRCKNNSGKFTHSLRPIPTIQLHELQLIHERVFLLIVLVQLWCRSNILYNIFMILSILNEILYVKWYRYGKDLLHYNPQQCWANSMIILI